MEEWIKIFEASKNKSDEIREFLEIFDEEKIPYKEEVIGRWRGTRTPIYEEFIVISIQKNYIKKVEKYIKDYNNPSNIVSEGIDELKENIKEKDIENSEEEEINRRHIIASKILAWIPIVLIIIVILCCILSSFISF